MRSNRLPLIARLPSGFAFCAKAEPAVMAAETAAPAPMNPLRDTGMLHRLSEQVNPSGKMSRFSPAPQP